jgi:hypothetical protein
MPAGRSTILETPAEILMMKKQTRRGNARALEAEKNAEVFFFGCQSNRSPGHRLWTWKSKITFKKIPWGSHINGGLLREFTAIKGGARARRAVYQRWRGWTIISFDDLKGDAPPGSNSAFFAHAELTIVRLIELAALQWPELARRIPPIHRFTELAATARASEK